MISLVYGNLVAPISNAPHSSAYEASMRLATTILAVLFSIPQTLYAQADAATRGCVSEQTLASDTLRAIAIRLHPKAFAQQGGKGFMLVALIFDNQCTLVRHGSAKGTTERLGASA